MSGKESELRKPPTDADVDPITIELISEGMIAIVREMRSLIIRTAHSSIIYDGQDFSCVIVDKDGKLVAKAAADSPMHIFPIPWSIEEVLKRFGDDMAPGDIFIHNDPYTGGTHLNDVATIYPVFVDNELFAFTVVRAHWGDIGGMTPGSISGQAREIYQEGLRFPAIRVYQQGEPNAAALEIIFANVRAPQDRRGDFEATLISCERASRKLEALVSRFGSGTVRFALAALLERAEARTLEQVGAVPDGEYYYEAYVESTGRSFEPLLARVTVRIEGGRLLADFTGSSAQSEGPTNVGPSMAPSAVFTVVKSYLDRTESLNHGAWLPLTTVVPKGTFLNAQLPAACGGPGDARYAADSALMGALSSAVPDLATGDNKGTGNITYISGTDERGKLFVRFEYPVGGCGAWSGGDGNNAMRNFQEGDFSAITPAEVVETENPLLVERSEIRSDSAGAGRYRGGLGVQREIRILADAATLSVLSERNVLGPYGACGGSAGAPNRYTVRRDGKEIEPSEIPGKVSSFPLLRDDVVVMRSAGGGGYGDPLDRPVEQVLADLREGYLSHEAARDQYGVVTTDSGAHISKTTQLRAEIRQQRVVAELIGRDEDEFEGARRVIAVTRNAASLAGIAEDDVLELVNPHGAPLRGWSRIVEEDGLCVFVGPQALKALLLPAGAHIWLRKLCAWNRTATDAQPVALAPAAVR